jgi:hypothetical protein
MYVQWIIIKANALKDNFENVFIKVLLELVEIRQIKKIIQINDNSLHSNDEDI